MSGAADSGHVEAAYSRCCCRRWSKQQNGGVWVAPGTRAERPASCSASPVRSACRRRRSSARLRKSLGRKHLTPGCAQDGEPIEALGQAVRIQAILPGESREGAVALDASPHQTTIRGSRRRIRLARLEADWCTRSATGYAGVPERQGQSSSRSARTVATSRRSETRGAASARTTREAAVPAAARDRRRPGPSPPARPRPHRPGDDLGNGAIAGRE